MYRDNIVRDQILQYPREAGCFWLYGIDITLENVKIYFLCIDISVLAFTSVAPPSVSQFPHVSFPLLPLTVARQRSITNVVVVVVKYQFWTTGKSLPLFFEKFSIIITRMSVPSHNFYIVIRPPTEDSSMMDKRERE